MKSPLQATFLLLSCAVSAILCGGGITGSSGSYGPIADSGYGTYEPGKLRPIIESGGSSGSLSPGRVVQAALHTKHSIRFINVDIPSEDREPHIIEVGASPLPIIMHFKSASSRIRLQQSHSGGQAGSIQETKSEDQPSILRHEVIKPIIQEVREVLLPYRKIIQEIRPVTEEIQTIVAKKSDVESGKEPGSGGIVGSVTTNIGGGNQLLPSYGGITGTVVGSGNVKRSTRWSNNYGRY